MMEEARDQIKTIAKDIDWMRKENKVVKCTFIPEKLIEVLIGNVTALGKLDINVKSNPYDSTESLESSDEINST